MSQVPSMPPGSEDSLVTAEYNTLREEILKRIEGLQQIDASIFLSSFITIVTLALQINNAIPILILLYPVFIMLVTVLWATTDRRIRTIGNYINTHIEKGKGWEGYIRNIRGAKTQFDLPDTFKMIVLVCFGLLAIPLGYFVKTLDHYAPVFGSLSFIDVVIADIVCVVLSVLMLLHATMLPIPMPLERVVVEQESKKNGDKWECVVRTSPDHFNQEHVEYYLVHTHAKKAEKWILHRGDTVSFIGYPDPLIKTFMKTRLLQPLLAGFHRPIAPQKKKQVLDGDNSANGRKDPQKESTGEKKQAVPWTARAMYDKL